MKNHTQYVAEKRGLYYLRLHYHTEFLKHSVFKSLCKMIHEQVAATVTIELISKKNKSKKKTKKERIYVRPWLKEGKS